MDGTWFSIEKAPSPQRPESFSKSPLRNAARERGNSSLSSRQRLVCLTETKKYRHPILTSIVGGRYQPCVRSEHVLSSRAESQRLGGPLFLTIIIYVSILRDAAALFMPARRRTANLPTLFPPSKMVASATGGLIHNGSLTCYSS